jgi:hypothetical protein
MFSTRLLEASCSQVSPTSSSGSLPILETCLRVRYGLKQDLIALHERWSDIRAHRGITGA